MLAHSSTLKHLSSRGTSLRTAGERGVNITLRQWQRMSLSVSMGSANTQNGISGSTIGTPRIRNEDTNFHTAISKMFIDAAWSLRRAGQANINITKLKMRLPN